jgi:hypothetical protein
MFQSLLNALEAQGKDLSKMRQENLVSAKQAKSDLFEINDFAKKYENIAHERAPAALIVYCIQLLNWAMDPANAKIETDSPEQASGKSVPNTFEDYKKQVSLLFKDIFDGDFPACRYSLENNPHLSKIASIAPAILDKWAHDKRSLSVEELLNQTLVNTNPAPLFNSREFLLNAIIRDLHLGPDYSSKYPLLTVYFAEHIHQDLILRQFEEKRSELQIQQIPTTDKAFRQLTFEEKLIRYLMQSQIIEGQEKNESKRITEQLVPLLQELSAFGLDYLGSQNSFVEDLKTAELKLSAYLRPSPFDPSRYKKWTVKRTDHWMDLLLLGTEVPGSCQDIYGNPELNRCLLSYVQDGKNQGFILVDEKGRIQSGSLGSLLLLNGILPVLFKEQSYECPIPSQLHSMLDTLFLQTAQELGVPLIEAKDTRSEMIEESKEFIESMGGPSPWEYVDALGNRGNKNSSVFKIPFDKCIVLFDPNPKPVEA